MSISLVSRAVINRLILFSFGSFLGLAAVECLARLHYRYTYSSPSPYGLQDFSGDRLKYVRLTPGYDGVSKVGVHYRTNSDGFRDDEIDSSLAHIIFLGDSTTFGLNIEHEETYAEKVEQLLVQRGYAIQSINTAAPGQSTLDQLTILSGLLRSPKVMPRAVVIGFFENDFSDNLQYVTTVEKSSGVRGALKQFIRSFRLGIHILEAYSYLRNKRYLSRTSSVDIRQDTSDVLNDSREYSFEPGRELEWDLLSKEEIPSNRSFRVTTEAFKKVAALLEPLGIPLIVARLPCCTEHDILHRRVPLYEPPLRQELTQVNGVTYVDVDRTYGRYLTEHGIQTALPQGFFSAPGDVGHPGPLASTLIAQSLVEVLPDLLGHPSSSAVGKPLPLGR